MEHTDKAKFILALHKHSLQAFDSGGTVLGTTNSGGATPNATNPNNGFAGSIGSALGLNNQFQAGAAQVQAGTNTGQLNQAYMGAQQGIAGQQAFANQAAAQGGFGNQSNVFAQQQALANQLQQQALGQGPNVAQNQLAQSTGQNIANQGAMMAGQRGAGANVGLMARQAGQQGAATQQQAAGQAATLGAQQQIAAQSALANQQAQMQGVSANQIAAQGQGANNVSSAQQNEQNILQNANTSFNNAGVAMQSNINNVNAQTAASNQNMAGNIFGGIMNAGSSAMSMLAEGGEVDAPEETGSFQGTQSEPSAGPSVPSTASNPSAGQNPFVSSGGGKSGGGGGAGLAMLAAANGGEIMTGYADGGVTGPALMPASSGGPMSFAGQWLNSNSAASGGPNVGATASNPAMQNANWGAQTKSQSPDAASKSDLSKFSFGMAAGGKVDPKMSATGGKVNPTGPGQKAIKKDNSYSNDKIPALLSEGEIVLPRSVTTHPQAPQKAAEFVQAVLAKRMKGKK